MKYYTVIARNTFSNVCLIRQEKLELNVIDGILNGKIIVNNDNSLYNNLFWQTVFNRKIM